MIEATAKAQAEMAAVKAEEAAVVSSHVGGGSGASSIGQDQVVLHQMSTMCPILCFLRARTRSWRQRSASAGLVLRLPLPVCWEATQLRPSLS